MTTDRQETPRPEKASTTGVTQVGQVINSLERLTRRLPNTRIRRRRVLRSNNPAPPREQLMALIAALGDTTHPLHAIAVDELVEIGAPAVPALCDVISPQQSWLSAYRAAEALGRIGDGRAAGALISALQHMNSNVRWSAVRALTTVGDMRSLFELRRVAQNDQGRTSWGEPVAGAAQSALDQLAQRSVWGQSMELIKTAVTCVLMILALTLAFSVVTTLRSQIDGFGLFIPGQTELPELALPTAAPTAEAQAETGSAAIQPTSAPLDPEPTTAAVEDTLVTGTVQQDSNIRPAPNTTNEPIGRLSPGDEVVFLARTDNNQWYLIQLGEEHAAGSAINNPDGSASGWINEALVSAPDGELPVQSASDTNP